MTHDTKYRIEINLITRLLRATPPVHCTGKFWMKKRQNMLVWLSKVVLAEHFCT